MLCYKKNASQKYQQHCKLDQCGIIQDLQELTKCFLPLSVKCNITVTLRLHEDCIVGRQQSSWEAPFVQELSCRESAGEENRR